MEYLQLLEKFGIAPNFWCSEEYFRRAGWREVEPERGVVQMYLDDDPMLPPIHREQGVLEGFCFSDFEGYMGLGEPLFLDYEYIYDPVSFIDMTGKRWAVFRKNVRKFPQRIGEVVVYRPAEDFCASSEPLNDWLENKVGEDIHDAETMLDFVLNGENRKVLVGLESGNVYGINVWDSNYLFINYRFCFHTGEDFLSEFLRFCFYLDPDVQFQKKMVNDGGSLDKDNLRSFKLKMNPIRERRVYTWAS